MDIYIIFTQFGGKRYKQKFIISRRKTQQIALTRLKHP